MTQNKNAWQVVGTDRGYTFWINRSVPTKPLYNVTDNGKMPVNYAGYYSIDSCIDVKNCSRHTVMSEN